MLYYQNGDVIDVKPETRNKPQVAEKGCLTIATRPGGVPHVVNGADDIRYGEVVERIPIAAKG